MTQPTRLDIFNSNPITSIQVFCSVRLANNSRKLYWSCVWLSDVFSLILFFIVSIEGARVTMKKKTMKTMWVYAIIGYTRHSIWAQHFNSKIAVIWWFQCWLSIRKYTFRVSWVCVCVYLCVRPRASVRMCAVHMLALNFPRNARMVHILIFFLICLP